MKGAGSAGALLVGSSLLAACGGGSETAATTAAGKTQDVTIRYWSHDKVLLPPYLEHVGKTLSAEPDPPYRYTLDTTIVPVDQVPTKARTAFLANSNAPDLLNVEISFFSQLMPIAEETLVDLTDLVEPVRAENVDKLWRPYTVGDRVYGIETIAAWSTYYYREDEFKALGLEPTYDTWDEFLVEAERKAVPKGKVLSLVASQPGITAAVFVPYLLQAGGQVFNPDGSLAIKSQAAVDALAFVSKAVQAGVFQAVANPFAGPGIAALKSGKLIGQYGADWYNVFILQPTVPDQRGKWRSAPLSAFTADGPRTSYWGGACLSVAKNSPVADAAVELVKAALLSEEAQLEKFERTSGQPTWKSVYENPTYLKTPDKFLGGQKLGELYADVSQNPPEAFVQSADFNAAAAILDGEILAAYKGQKSAQDAIADAAAAIESKINS